MRGPGTVSPPRARAWCPPSCPLGRVCPGRVTPMEGTPPSPRGGGAAPSAGAGSAANERVLMSCTRSCLSKEIKLPGLEACCCA